MNINHIIMKKDKRKDTPVFIKNRKSDSIFWIDNPDVIGEHLFSFDKQKVFNLFEDYPHNLTKEQKEIFDKENPEWKEFFKNRVVNG